MSLHSKLFKFSGKSTTLSCILEEPLELDENVDYGIGLINLETYHSYPNIVEGENNKLYIGSRQISIPTGAYELDDIERYIKDKLIGDEFIEIQANLNTIKCAIKSNRVLDFSKADSLGSMLGFSKKLEANKFHESEKPVDIMKTNAICVDCSIATGSYVNGESGHLIYSFFPQVPVGYKIVETPQNVIYLPLSTKSIRSITLKIVDQDGKLLNLQGESITIVLHLRAV